jgi:hypothetical protein
MTLLLTLGTLARAACPDPEPALARAMEALITGDTVPAKAALMEVEASFPCAPVTPSLLARHWLARGAAAEQEGDAAGPWFAVARHVSPETWEPRLGPGLRSTWSAATAAGATLAIEPSGHAWVDGTLMTAWPIPTTAGPHLVQVLDSAGAVSFSRVVTLLPDERALVQTGLTPSLPTLDAAPTAARPPSPPPVTRPPRRGRTALAAGAVVTLVISGTAAWQARAQDDAMRNAPDLDTLDRVYGTQVAWAWTAWGTLGTAAALGATAVLVR